MPRSESLAIPDPDSSRFSGLTSLEHRGALHTRILGSNCACALPGACQKLRIPHAHVRAASRPTAASAGGRAAQYQNQIAALQPTCAVFRGRAGSAAPAGQRWRGGGNGCSVSRSHSGILHMRPLIWRIGLRSQRCPVVGAQPFPQAVRGTPCGRHLQQAGHVVSSTGLGHQQPALVVAAPLLKRLPCRKGGGGRRGRGGGEGASQAGRDQARHVRASREGMGLRCS